MSCRCCVINFFFFFNDTATTEIYTLSLHDALPICLSAPARSACPGRTRVIGWARLLDRKSTRLNSSHQKISYAVFCLKKKIMLQSLKSKLKAAVSPAKIEEMCRRD